MSFIAFMIGATLGGFLGAYFFGWLVEKFAFRELEPDQRSLRTALAGWALTGLLASWGLGQDGSLEWRAWLYYAPGAVLFWFYYRAKLRKAWDDGEDAEAFK